VKTNACVRILILLAAQLGVDNAMAYEHVVCVAQTEDLCLRTEKFMRCADKDHSNDEIVEGICPDENNMGKPPHKWTLLWDAFKSGPNCGITKIIVNCAY
jgi:hypothetical protein